MPSKKLYEQYSRSEEVNLFSLLRAIDDLLKDKKALNPDIAANISKKGTNA